MHGTPGSPGAPGRDGRDGTKGDRGSPEKGWAPRTSWPLRKHGFEGRAWCPGSYRSKGTARGERREWKCRAVSGFLAYELERMYMEERRLQRLGSDPSNNNLTDDIICNFCLKHQEATGTFLRCKELLGPSNLSIDL